MARCKRSLFSLFFIETTNRKLIYGVYNADHLACNRAEKLNLFVQLLSGISQLMVDQFVVNSVTLSNYLNSYQTVFRTNKRLSGKQPSNESSIAYQGNEHDEVLELCVSDFIARIVHHSQ